MEIWKDIPKYIGIYQASNKGRIRSLDRFGSDGRKLKGKLRKLSKDSRRYLKLTLTRNRKQETQRVARLVLETFVGPCPERMEACHNNGKRNDNRLENLRWDTRSNNALDQIKHRTDSSTTHNKPVRCIETNEIYKSETEAARQTGINRSHISAVCRGIRKTAGGYHWEFV